MKISPIEIRQHTFEKGFRGYDVDRVDAFLNSLSQEWERVMNENKMLKMQLEIAEKELNKLRDVEMTLFRTLKTAEDTSTQITEQANRAAEKYLQESRQKTDEVMNETKRKASMIVQDAENQAKYIREEVINELKNQERDFKAMEKYRDNLVVQLRSLASTTNETVERFEKKFGDTSFHDKMDQITQQIEEGDSQTEEMVNEYVAEHDLEDGRGEGEHDSESAEGGERPDHEAQAGESTPADDRQPDDGEGHDEASVALAEAEMATQSQSEAAEADLPGADASGAAASGDDASGDEPQEHDDSQEHDETTPEEVAEEEKEKGSFFDQIN